MSSHRKLVIPLNSTYLLQRLRDIWSHHRDVSHKSSYRCKEVAKQHQYPIHFDQEAEEGPPQEDERDTGGEGSGAFPLLAACEEGGGLLKADYKCEADEEEYVAHCQPEIMVRIGAHSL